MNLIMIGMRCRLQREEVLTKTDNLQLTQLRRRNLIPMAHPKVTELSWILKVTAMSQSVLHSVSAVDSAVTETATIKMKIQTALPPTNAVRRKNEASFPRRVTLFSTFPLTAPNTAIITLLPLPTPSEQISASSA